MPCNILSPFPYIPFCFQTNRSLTTQAQNSQAARGTKEVGFPFASPPLQISPNLKLHKLPLFVSPRFACFQSLSFPRPGSTPLTRCGGSRKYYPGQHGQQRSRNRSWRPCDPDLRLVRGKSKMAANKSREKRTSYHHSLQFYSSFFLSLARRGTDR